VLWNIVWCDQRTSNIVNLKTKQFPRIQLNISTKFSQANLWQYTIEGGKAHTEDQSLQHERRSLKEKTGLIWIIENWFDLNNIENCFDLKIENWFDLNIGKWFDLNIENWFDASHIEN